MDPADPQYQERLTRIAVPTVPLAGSLPTFPPELMAQARLAGVGFDDSETRADWGV